MHSEVREARSQPRSIDYPFMSLRSVLTRTATAEGKLSVPHQITYDKDKQTVVLENYASEPVRLQSVKVEVKK